MCSKRRRWSGWAARPPRRARIRRPCRRPATAFTPFCRRLIARRFTKGADSLIRKETDMKWITREKARVDRIACPWLISRFIDKSPEFLFVPADQVMDVAKREQAIPYDVPSVELGHQGDHCSFDAFLVKYKLDDPALQKLALIVRGADTSDRELTPESAGLYAYATR